MRNYILILLTVLIFIACKKENKLQSDNALMQKIQEKVLSGQRVLNLKEVTAFEWDSLIILTPYTNYERIEEQYSINLTDVKHSNIQSRDDINQLVFYKNNSLYKMVEYPRYPGDFSNNDVSFILKDSADFEIIKTIQKTETGEDWIQLIKL